MAETEPSPNIVDQEKAVDLAIKSVERQSYHVLLTIEQNNLRFCLKQAKLMLNELRTNILTPKRYFQLYNVVFEEMKKVEDFMKLEITHGRHPEDIYESVQQCQYVIPRLYLTILAASVYIEKCPDKCRDILNDLLEQVKSSQNPLRGVFTRHFLLQILKDKLPDNDNIYVKEKGGNFEDSVFFLIKNLEEINRLWIRLTSDAPELERPNKEIERINLKPLIAESINIISSLEGLTMELYENLVLPKIIEIIFMYNDPLSQEYIMECIIRSFPVEYNIKCMEFILLTISKLSVGVNVKMLFIIMLVKLTIYYESNEKSENEEEKKKIITDSYSVYPILMRNFDIIMSNEMRSPDKYILDILELNISFLKYTIKCSPENEILNSLNHILNLNVQILQFFNPNTFLKNEIDKIGELLAIPLESIYSLFDMPDFPNILNYLDYNNMKSLGLSIINNLINPNSKEKLDSIEKINKLFLFIRPLLNNIKGPEEEKAPNFQKDQNTVSKLIFVVKSENPEILLDIYTQFKNVFYEGGKNRRIITLPSLANVLIYFSTKISTLYENKNKNENENENEENNKENELDISKFENDDIFYEFLNKIYELLIYIIKVLEEEFPEMAFRLNLLASAQVDNIQILREKLEEKSLLFFNNGLEIYKAFDKEKNNKFDYFSYICQILLKNTIFSKENLENVIKFLYSEAKNMAKRTDQCNGYLIVSQLYYQHFKDKKNIMDCLNAAKKVADFSLTNPHNLILYIFLLNKYIYYIDVDNEDIVEIKPDQIGDLIEAIKNHIYTIKTDKSIDACFLPEIEKYFKNTVSLIEMRKKDNEHKKIYDEINISSE